MMLATETMIPSFDMLGLPVPAWLAHLLMGLTLALHWLFLSMTAGGAGAFLLMRPKDALDGRRRGMAAFLPFSLSMAMTLGIAPLLFVQVLYGQFFYTANVLMGWVWLGLLVLMAINFYALYYSWYRLKRGLKVGALGLLVLILMGGSAVVLAGNATLLQNPQDWQEFRSASGLVPYLGDATFLPRMGFALAALVAGGGLFVAVYMRITPKLFGEAAGREIPKAMAFSLLGLLGMLGCGLWGSLSLAEDVRKTLLGGAEAVFPVAAIAAVAAGAVLTILAVRKPSLPLLVLSALAYFVGLLSAAYLRDAMRRAALAKYFKLGDVTVHSQWDSFAVFAIAFVVGLGLVAYMVMSAFKPKAGAA